MYFHEAEVRSLMVTIRQCFPGAEVVFDAFLPYLVHANNLRMALGKLGARYHWALKRGKDLEQWGDGIRLLDESFPFSQPEPRLAQFAWMRLIPFFARAIGIFHYRFGEAAATNPEGRP